MKIGNHKFFKVGKNEKTGLWEVNLHCRKGKKTIYSVVAGSFPNKSAALAHKVLLEQEGN